MPQINFTLSPDGLLLPALLGLDASAMQDLQAQGQPLPRPLQVRGQIDTGSLVTGVGPAVLAALGASSVGASRTQTASGLVVVQLYRISFTIYEPTGQSNATLSRTSWLVTNLPQDLPDIEVLFGMDLVRQLNLNVQGPAGEFTLDF